MMEVMLPSENLNLGCSEELKSLSKSVDYTDVSVVPEHDKQVLEQSVSSLKAEISGLRLKERSLDGRRREALDKILDIKGSIRVFGRVRSSLSISKRKIVQSHISAEPEKIAVRSNGTKKEFSLDRVFPQDATQEDVFAEVEPILRAALDGHNVCIFAYGQTGTGKTFTMEGTTEQKGIVPRAIEELFLRACQSTSFTLSMSMLEVYMGSLRDLLGKRKSSARGIDYNSRSGLSILTDSNGYIEIEGLTDVLLTDVKQANWWYAKGKRARSTSWTNVNEASSRSHCLTRITIARSEDVEEGRGAVSRLWMVDLGGSERLQKTGATGQTLDEGKAINLSLSALGDVIAALKMKHNHIPYRHSKLTQALSDSLGNGSKVLMIVHISPSDDDARESICSLNFAKRARAIEASKGLSEDFKKQKEELIHELDKQIIDTEEELRRVKRLIEKLEKQVLEKKRLLAHQIFEDQKGSPRSPLIISQQEVAESPKITEKSASKVRPSSIPRFMASTVCSRQRLNADRELSWSSRSRIRTSVNMVGSQSLSYSEPYFKANSKSSKVNSETNISRQRRELSHLSSQENPSYNSRNLKSSSSSTNKKISTYHPIFRVTMHQHRRRMSDLT